MPPKNRSKDTKDSATKGTLNPPTGGKPGSPGAEAVANPSTVGNRPAPSDRAGQFTGKGVSGLQKK